MFDKEYATQFRDEVLFLRKRNILYAFVKNVNGISTYKYTKTPELFGALRSFYIERLEKGDCYGTKESKKI